MELKFDMSEPEVMKVSTTVKDLCMFDKRAFCFMSNYLLKCCYNMQEKGLKLDSIA